MEIRLLADHRNDLVAERTRIQNRLRWHLRRVVPRARGARSRSARCQKPRQLDRVDRRLRRLAPRRPVCGSRASEVAQIRSLTRQANTLENELLALIKTHRPQLLAETGCGPLTAAILIGRTAGAERFQTDASFALQSGIAPIKCSSGQHQQHRLNRGGDRQLNHALHIIAITRARRRPEQPASTSHANKPKARPRKARCAASSATSPAASGSYSPSRRSQTRPSHASRLSPSRSPSLNAPPHVERSTARSPGRSRWSASPSCQQPDQSPSAASYQPTIAAGLLRSPPKRSDHDRCRPRRRQTTRSQPLCRPRPARPDRQHPPKPALPTPPAAPSPALRNPQTANLP